MIIYLYRIFSAFVYTVGNQLDPSKESFNKEVNFVFTQFLNMSWYLIFAFSLLVIFFDIVLSKNCKPFHLLGEDERSKKLSILKNSNIGVIKDFIRFFSSLTTFAYSSYEY